MDLQAEFLTRFLRSEVEIRAFVSSVVRDAHAREDVLQDIAMTLWQRFESYDPGRSFAAWARGIAAKKLMARWRHTRRAPVPFSPAAIQMLAEAADRTEARPAPSWEALDHCLGRLPDRSRRLLALRYGKARSLDVMAAELKMTVDAIYQALSRLRRHLRDCMERWLAAQGETGCRMTHARNN